MSGNTRKKYHLALAKNCNKKHFKLHKMYAGKYAQSLLKIKDKI